MSKWRKWWSEHDGLVGMSAIAVGMLALGAMLSTIYFEMQTALQRSRHAKEIRVLVRNYRETLDAKDQLIANLAQQTTQAAKTANRAAITADHAARDKRPDPELERWTK